MARGTVTVTTLTINDGVAISGTAIDATNGLLVRCAGDTGRMFMYVDYTAGTAATVTVKAGDNPPGFQSILGDLTEVFASIEKKMFTLEGARFIQSDDPGGDIFLDFTPGMTGTIYAYRLPKGL
jgi:hypothetical protein